MPPPAFGRSGSNPEHTLSGKSSSVWRSSRYEAYPLAHVLATLFALTSVAAASANHSFSTIVK